MTTAQCATCRDVQPTDDAWSILCPGCGLVPRRRAELGQPCERCGRRVRMARGQTWCLECGGLPPPPGSLVATTTPRPAERQLGLDFGPHEPRQRALFPRRGGQR